MGAAGRTCRVREVCVGLLSLWGGQATGARLWWGESKLSSGACGWGTGFSIDYCFMERSWYRCLELEVLRGKGMCCDCFVETDPGHGKGRNLGALLSSCSDSEVVLPTLITFSLLTRLPEAG